MPPIKINSLLRINKKLLDKYHIKDNDFDYNNVIAMPEIFKSSAYNKSVESGAAIIIYLTDKFKKTYKQLTKAELEVLFNNVSTIYGPLFGYPIEKQEADIIKSIDNYKNKIESSKYRELYSLGEKYTKAFYRYGVISPGSWIASIWGTFEKYVNLEIEDINDNEVILHIETRYDPPIGVVQKMMLDNPDCFFKFEYQKNKNYTATIEDLSFIKYPNDDNVYKVLEDRGDTLRVGKYPFIDEKSLLFDINDPQRVNKRKLIHFG